MELRVGKRKMRERAVLVVVALACWLGPACSDAQVRARGLGPPVFACGSAR